MTADLTPWLGLVIAGILGVVGGYVWGTSSERSKWRPCGCNEVKSDDCRFSWIIPCECECHGELMPCVCREERHE